MNHSPRLSTSFTVSLNHHSMTTYFEIYKQLSSYPIYSEHIQAYVFLYHLRSTIHLKYNIIRLHRHYVRHILCLLLRNLRSLGGLVTGSWLHYGSMWSMRLLHDNLMRLRRSISPSTITLNLFKPPTPALLYLNNILESSFLNNSTHLRPPPLRIDCTSTILADLR